MQTYHHSGAVSPVGLILASIAGTATAIVLGFVYAFFIVWMPSIYACFLGTVLFSIAIGAVVAWSAQLGKIRNDFVVSLIGFCAALLGLYVEWGASPLALLGGKVGLRGFDPLVMLDFMQMLYENGSWGLVANAPIKGLVLVLFWVAEAIVVLGGATLMAYSLSVSRPFCERCYQWTKWEKSIRVFSAVTVGDEVEARLKAGDLTVLQELPVMDKKVARYIQVDAASCPSCGEGNCITVKIVSRKVDDRGKETLFALQWVSNMIVSSAEIASIRRVGKPPWAGP